MNGDRRKELLAQYKRERPQMGVYAYRCPAENRVYLGASQNLAGTMNSIAFQLANGSFITNRRLSEDWKRYGEDGFVAEVLEPLTYDKDESKTDYSDDLKVLKELWREQLTRGGAIVENIKPKDR